MSHPQSRDDSSHGAGRTGVPSHRRRNWQALALAVAMAAPAVSTRFAPLHADEAAPPVQQQPAADPFATAPARQPTAAEMKALYADAVKSYKAGDHAAAREKFRALEAGGFKAGAFQKSPATYLKELDEKAPAAAAAEPVAAEVPAATEAPAAAEAQPAPQPAGDARDVFLTAKRQYERKQYDEARRNFEAAAKMGFEPRMFEDSPAEYLARIERRHAVLANAQAQPEQGQLAPADAQQGLQQTAEAQRVQADALVDQARAAEERQDFAGALEAYSRAADLDPNNAAATQGRNRMQTLTGRGPVGGEGGLLGQEERRIRALQQETRYSFNQAIDNTTAAIAANDFDTARLALERARAARNVNPGIFPQEEVAQFDQRLAETSTALERSAAEFARTETARQRQEVLDAQRRNMLEQDEARRRTVADLVGNSRTLVREARYTDALGVLDQILVLDPQNDYATGVRPLVQDKALFQEQRRYREEFDINFTKQLNQAEEKKIPYDDILRYPANWPDISELRDQTAAEERGEGAADQATQAVLNRQLPEVNFNNIGFADVIEFLRDVTGANIFVNWRALEGAGIDRAAPVTARLRNVKFSKALDTILSDVGGGVVTLGYTIDEGVITISTSEDLSRNTVTRVYDIRDLIIQVPDFEEPPDFQLGQTASISGGGGGGGGQSLFGGGATGDEEEEVTREELVEQIVLLIQETVAPDSWRDAGGVVGSVRELSGQLIVTQTPENQRLLANLLEQLRETRAIQVTIEARFLTVQRNFLEDVGIDVDFAFNTDDDDPDGFGPIPVSNNGLLYTSNPSTGVPGSIGSISPGTADPDNPLSLGVGALQLSGTYLDNFTVNFLVRATQAAQNITTVTAPRVTLFNGQRAFVVVSTQTAYVSDLEPVVGTDSVGFDPTIDIVESGVLLDVQATVSADRKYVTLTLRPSLSRLVALQLFTVQSAADTTGGDDDDDVDPTGGIATATIQQPIVETTQVRTTVSVPDGGTLLLGGQTLAGEVERESGAPIVSKIPFVKRLFTNRSMAKDEQVLLILVKPTIIIQREQEQKQFPLLSTRIGAAGGGS